MPEKPSAPSCRKMIPDPVFGNTPPLMRLVLLYPSLEAYPKSACFVEGFDLC